MSDDKSESIDLKSDAYAGQPTSLFTDQLQADTELELERLAGMSELGYERERKSAADRLGMRAAVLDTMVGRLRAPETSGGKGRPLKLPMAEPWDQPVDGRVLLAELTAAIRKHVVVEEGAAEAVALWVLHAYTLDAFVCSPRLGITSPEKGCGKSTLLDVVSKLVPRALPTCNVTPAAIFRTIEAVQPTLLIDEADTFLTEDASELRGILNSGHRRIGAVTRLVGDDHEPRMFSTWAATAIAAIGRLPDTLEDRSVPIRLRRRRPDEPVEPLRIDRTPHLDRLARMAARWAADTFEQLRDADPVLPASITNRAADNWRPLIAIADAIGGDWPERARQVALALTAGQDGQSSMKAMLLEDIRVVLSRGKLDRISSAHLVSALVELDGRPWAEWRHGKPLTPNALARLLTPFGVTPMTIRLSASRTAKGYMRIAFGDAFARYLPAQNDTASRDDENQAPLAPFEASQDSECDASKIKQIRMMPMFVTP